MYFCSILARTNQESNDISCMIVVSSLQDFQQDFDFSCTSKIFLQEVTGLARSSCKITLQDVQESGQISCTSCKKLQDLQDQCKILAPRCARFARQISCKTCKNVLPGNQWIPIFLYTFFLPL